MSRRIVVIINPIAGVRPKEELPSLIHSVFPAEEGYDVTIRFTERSGHASDMALEAAAAGIDTVVAIGGDGTINETARSLIDTQTSFGIVPMGSGNGLARHLEIPLDTRKALENVKENNAVQVDYGSVNEHIFFCTAGVGFDAQVSQKFAEMKQRGGLTYLRSAVEVMRDFQPQTYIIRTDDGLIEEKAFLIAIGNASQWGNNAYITPHASMQDGLLDATIVKPFPLYMVPRMALQLFLKNIDANRNIQTFRSCNYQIDLPQPQVVHIDGEPIWMEGTLDIRTHQSGLKVLVPAEPNHSLLEPLEYVFEDVHYSILRNLKLQQQELVSFNHKTLNQIKNTFAKWQNN